MNAKDISSPGRNRPTHYGKITYENGKEGMVSGFSNDDIVQKFIKMKGAFRVIIVEKNLDLARKDG